MAADVTAIKAFLVFFAIALVIIVSALIGAVVNGK